MNRTERLVKAHDRPVDDSNAASSLFSCFSHHRSEALFAPLHYEARYPYPLIVWLHGPGSDERQLLRVMPLTSMRNYVAVAPRGELLDAEGDDVEPRYGWPQSGPAIPQAEGRVFDAIRTASQKYHISPQKIFLAGFDTGGTMALRVAMNHPHRFAGVVSLGGPFPRGSSPLGHLAEARGVPILLAVGRQSLRYPPESVCDDLRLFHTAGLSATLRHYPGGHDISPQMLKDVDRWIIEQVTGTESCPEATEKVWLYES
jgi:phospholipase/carboxylesterase